VNVAPIVYPPALIKGSTWLQTVKMWIVGHVGLEKDALHIYFALTLVFGSVLLFRWSLRSWKPVALVLAVACIGEIWDIRDGLMTRVPLVVSLPLSIHDLWNTLFWPVAIFVLARISDVFGGQASPSAAEDRPVSLDSSRGTD
jgi:hypothetical protein